MQIFLFYAAPGTMPQMFRWAWFSGKLLSAAPSNMLSDSYDNFAGTCMLTCNL